MKLYAVVLSAVISIQAYGCESFSLQVNAFSKHINTQNVKYNESNPGLGIVCKDTSEGVDYFAGAYKNSFYRASWYAGRSDYQKSGAFTYGISYGMITGYYYQVTIAAYLTAGADFRTHKVNVLYAPTRLISPKGADVFTVTLEIPIH